MHVRIGIKRKMDATKLMMCLAKMEERVDTHILYS